MTLLPPGFLDNVIAIGGRTPEGKTFWIASGFLYGHKILGKDDQYDIFLVTCKHVLQDKKSIVIRLNNQDGQTSKEFDVYLQDKEGKNNYFIHQNKEIDCALLHLSPRKLIEFGIKITAFQNDMNVATKTKMANLGIAEGDSIFVLGFPLGIVDPKKNFAIIRGGIISRIRDMYFGNSNNFIIDASIFPGNSGGPVVTKPELTSIVNTPAVTSSYLVGIISSYIPYKDIAFSKQTKEPLLVIQENSGLAKVIPIDYIEEIINYSISKSH